jgi:multidrug efflux pump subunit AcrA (membrane-fusion protein)
VERIPDAVSVPLECVFEQEDRHIIYVRRGPDFVPTEVELGEENDDAVVVTEGLQGGEEIALREVGTSDGPGADANGSAPSSPLPR